MEKGKKFSNNLEIEENNLTINNINMSGPLCNFFVLKV